MKKLILIITAFLIGATICPSLVALADNNSQPQNYNQDFNTKTVAHIETTYLPNQTNIELGNPWKDGQIDVSLHGQARQEDFMVTNKDYFAGTNIFKFIEEIAKQASAVNLWELLSNVVTELDFSVTVHLPDEIDAKEFLKSLEVEKSSSSWWDFDTSNQSKSLFFIGDHEIVFTEDMIKQALDEKSSNPNSIIQLDKDNSHQFRVVINKLETKNFLDKLWEQLGRLGILTKIKNIAKNIWNWITGANADNNLLNFGFELKSNVSKLTTQGASIDPTNNKLLTKETLPPTKDKQLKFSIDGFGLESKHLFRQSDTINTWNEYISPWASLPLDHIWRQPYPSLDKQEVENILYTLPGKNILTREIRVPGTQKLSDYMQSYLGYPLANNDEAVNQFHRTVNICNKQLGNNSIAHQIYKKETQITTDNPDKKEIENNTGYLFTETNKADPLTSAKLDIKEGASLAIKVDTAALDKVNVDNKGILPKITVQEGEDFSLPYSLQLQNSYYNSNKVKVSYKITNKDGSDPYHFKREWSNRFENNINAMNPKTNYEVDIPKNSDFHPYTVSIPGKVQGRQVKYSEDNVYLKGFKGPDKIWEEQVVAPQETINLLPSSYTEYTENSPGLYYKFLKKTREDEKKGFYNDKREYILTIVAETSDLAANKKAISVETSFLIEVKQLPTNSLTIKYASENIDFGEHPISSVIDKQIYWNENPYNLRIESSNLTSDWLLKAKVTPFIEEQTQQEFPSKLFYKNPFTKGKGMDISDSSVIYSTKEMRDLDKNPQTTTVLNYEKHQGFYLKLTQPDPSNISLDKPYIGKITYTLEPYLDVQAK